MGGMASALETLTMAPPSRSRRAVWRLTTEREVTPA